MRTVELDRILGTQYPEAGFHDSELLAIAINYPEATAQLAFRIPVGITGHELLFEPGVLTFTGMYFVAVDPPASPPGEWLTQPLWITADGSFPDPAVKTGVVLPSSLPDSCICHYFFASNTNSFLIVAAENVSFRWAASSLSVWQ